MIASASSIVLKVKTPFFSEPGMGGIKDMPPVAIKSLS
jgi:hypothetical protein